MVNAGKLTYMGPMGYIVVHLNFLLPIIYYIPEKQSVHVYYILFCTRNYDGFPTRISSWWRCVSTSYSYTGLFVFSSPQGFWNFWGSQKMFPFKRVLSFFLIYSTKNQDETPKHPWNISIIIHICCLRSQCFFIPNIFCWVNLLHQVTLLWGSYSKIHRMF